MIYFVWPWLFLLLPLPFLVRRWLPPAWTGGGIALRVPYYQVLRKIMGRTSYRTPWTRVPFLAFLGWCLLVLAASQPLWVGDARDVPATGRDLMLVIDISGSMRQMDFVIDGEHLDRLTVVKQVAGRFIEGREGDRLGLILFGGQPYLRAPITYDHKVIKTLLEEAEVALAGEYTAIGDAIGLAIKRMRHLSSQSSVIVLLTDGANNEGQVGPRQAALLAASQGMRIYTIGVGGQDVVSSNPFGIWSADGAARFEQEVLEEIAVLTNGHYFHVLDIAGLESAYRKLDELEPALGPDMKDYLATPLYPWPLCAALLLSVWLAARPWLRGMLDRGGG